MADIPSTEPTELRAGDTWQWRRHLADYPASIWTLTYYFRNAAAHFDVAATADGDDFAVTVAMADSADIGAGWYDWIAVVASDTERHEVDRGRTQILPDYSAAANLDGRSYARQLLDSVEAELLKRGSSGRLDLIESVLADRQLKRADGGLIKLRNQLRGEVAREEAEDRRRQGLPSRNRLHFIG